MGWVLSRGRVTHKDNSDAQELPTWPLLQGESADSEILFTGTDMVFSSPGCCFLSVRGRSEAPTSSRGRGSPSHPMPQARVNTGPQAHRQLRVTRHLCTVQESAVLAADPCAWLYPHTASQMGYDVRYELKAGLNPRCHPWTSPAPGVPCPITLLSSPQHRWHPRGVAGSQRAAQGPAFLLWSYSLCWCRAFILVSRDLLGGSWWPV